ANALNGMFDKVEGLSVAVSPKRRRVRTQQKLKKSRTLDCLVCRHGMLLIFAVPCRLSAA
ncbi:MAG: hypothetical protein WB689_16765, partial [Xanthobacteraceae bacterium]